MAYADRRYEDDEPLAFEDRRDRRGAPPPPRRRGPAPVTLIVSVLLLGGVVGGVAWLYRDGARAPSGPPKVVGAPIAGVRTAAPVKPEEADPAAGLSIYKDDPNATTASPTFAPPPEQPMAREAPPPPAVVAKPSVAPAKPAPTPTIDTLIADANAKPVKAKAAEAPAKPEKAAKTEKAAAAADDADGAPVKAVVQIGAFSTEDLARKAYHDATRLGGKDAAGKAMRLVPLEKDGAPLYRVSMAGFTSKAAAQQVCDKLKSAGKSCFVR